MMITVRVRPVEGVDDGVAERMLKISLGESANQEIMYRGQTYSCWVCSPEFVEKFMESCRINRIPVEVLVKSSKGFATWGNDAPGEPEMMRPIVITPLRRVS